MASTALRPVPIHQLACATQVTIAPTTAQPDLTPQGRQSVQQVAIASRALLGLSTAKAATTTQQRARRPSLIVFSAFRDTGARARLSRHRTITAMTAITALQHPRSKSNGQPHQAHSPTRSMSGSCLCKRVHRAFIRTSGTSLNAHRAQRVSTAELRASPTPSLIAQLATIARRKESTQSSASREHTIQHPMLISRCTAWTAHQDRSAAPKVSRTHLGSAQQVITAHSVRLTRPRLKSTTPWKLDTLLDGARAQPATTAQKAPPIPSPAQSAPTTTPPIRMTSPIVRLAMMATMARRLVSASPHALASAQLAFSATSRARDRPLVPLCTAPILSQTRPTHLSSSVIDALKELTVKRVYLRRLLARQAPTTLTRARKSVLSARLEASAPREPLSPPFAQSDSTAKKALAQSRMYPQVLTSPQQNAQPGRTSLRRAVNSA